MADCTATWNDSLIGCANATGLGVPVEPTDDNYADRVTICTNVKCQQLFTVFTALISTKCPLALEQVAKYPKGMWTSEYCDVTSAPATLTPAPATTLIDPVTRAPTTEAVATQAPAPTESIVTPDTSTATKETSSSNTATIVGASSGGFVVVIIILLVVFRMRRQRQSSSRNNAAKSQDHGFSYSTVPTVTADDSLPKSGPLLSESELSAVRIPLEKIEIGEVISQGGYGEVARGVYNGRSVAVKRLLAGQRKDPLSIRSFFNEIQLTSTLEHDCIVRFIGVAWNVPADLCMVSEFMDGGDLRTMLAGYAASGHANGHDHHKLQIAIQIAHGLTYLHTLQPPVVHRDLKSRNVLLSANGHAKLIDFGISCERQDVTMTAGVGTSLWMAPEVMLGQRYDEKADVFSFGVMLSELDTHALPYDHARDSTSNRKLTDMVLMQLVSQGQLRPRFTEIADLEIVGLANDCLQLDPARRPRASEVLYRIHKSRQSGTLV